MTAPVAEAAPTTTGWIPDDEDTFAARLQAIRRHMKWGNTSEAARACGLSAENWRLWEQGRYPARLTVVAKQIAGATGCDYLWLVHGDGRGFDAPRRDGGSPTARYPVVRRDPLAPRVLERRAPRSADVVNTQGLRLARPVRRPVVDRPAIRATV